MPRRRDQLTFTEPKAASFSLRFAYGFVAFMKHTESYDTETGLHLTVVCKLPVQYADEPVKSFIYCRVNCFTSQSLLKSDFTAIRPVMTVAGIIVKTISDRKTAQLVAWGRVSAHDWRNFSPDSWFEEPFELDGTRIYALPLLGSANFPDHAAHPQVNSSIVLHPISKNIQSQRKAPPPPPFQARERWCSTPGGLQLIHRSG